MRDVGNWVGELTTTTGTGPITLGGALSGGYVTFDDIGITSVEYAIVDGDNREAGLGTIASGILTRDVIQSTVVNGNYSGNSPSAISLSGLAEVYSTFNRIAYDEMNTAVVKVSNIEANAKDDQVASEVPFTPASGVIATDVQAAIQEVAVAAISGINLSADYSWTGVHTFTQKPTYGGEGFVVPSELTLLTIDLTASYAWTGQHTFTLRPTINGNIVYDAGNINDAVLGINAQTGTSYTFALTDAGDLVTMNNASANTITVPPNSSVAFPVGTVLTVRQKGVGQTTIVEGSGVTIEVASSKGLLISERYEWASIVKEATNTWSIAGGLTS